jgi:hypothetical protein
MFSSLRYHVITGNGKSTYKQIRPPKPCTGVEQRAWRASTYASQMREFPSSTATRPHSHTATSSQWCTLPGGRASSMTTEPLRTSSTNVSRAGALSPGSTQDPGRGADPTRIDRATSPYHLSLGGAATRSRPCYLHGRSRALPLTIFV